MAKADLAPSRARFAPLLLFALAATTACEDKVPVIVDDTTAPRQ